MGSSKIRAQGQSPGHRYPCDFLRKEQQKYLSNTDFLITPNHEIPSI